MEKHKRIGFLNTFVPVIPIWQYLFTDLESSGYDSEGFVSRYHYRNDGEKQGSLTCWLPSSLSKNTIFCHLFYYLLAPVWLLTRKFDLLLFFTQPPMFVIVGSAISRMRGIPYVVHIMDLYPDMLVSTGSIKVGGLIHRLLGKLMRSCLNRAKRVVAIGQCMREKLITMGVEEDKIVVMPNFAKNDRSKTISQVKAQADGKPNTGVLYLGNMGRPHQFNTLLHVAERSQNLQFLLIGSGHRKRYVQQEVEKRGLKNIVLRDSLEQSEFAEALKESSIHFISLKEEFTGVSVPSKFYSSLQSGATIIFEGSVNSEIARYILNEGCPAHFINGSDHEGFLRIIKNQILFDRKQVSEYYYKRFESKTYIKKYINMIAEEV